jgi:hypothetical protein
VQDTVAAGCAVEGDADRPDPISVWNDLQMDTASSWGNAGMFRKKLGVSIAVLCPAHLRDARPPMLAGTWPATRFEAARALDTLIAEYRLIASTPGAA